MPDHRLETFLPDSLASVLRLDLYSRKSCSMGSYCSKSHNTPACWPTFRAEWNPCQDFYSVHDPVTDRIIDVPESFAPLSFLAVFGKMLTATVTIGTFVWSLLDRDNIPFGFAYLSFWTMTVQSLYHILSLSNSILASSIDQPQNYIQGRPKATWWFFNTSLAASIIVAG